jgi:excisionase family DNA binding protein
LIQDTASLVRHAFGQEKSMAELAYTIDEVCNLSKLGRTTIYAAIRDGDLKARKFRRRTIVLHEDLSRFLENLPEIFLRSPIQT